METPWVEWDHVLKIDPDKDLPSGVTYEDVVTTGTDAIEIGGTTGITEDKMEAVITACGEHGIPLYQEPSGPGVVVHREELDGYLIPTVMNTTDGSWITGLHKEWVRLDPDIRWDRTWTEAYIVLNPDSAVAMTTGADCDQSAEDVAAFATVADRFFNQPIVYIEYSGTLGDADTVRAAHEALDDAVLFYGGGIRSYEAAYEMRSRSDTVVVGDLFHDEGIEAVRATVRGAADAA